MNDKALVAILGYVTPILVTFTAVVWLQMIGVQADVPFSLDKGSGANTRTIIYIPILGLMLGISIALQLAFANRHQTDTWTLRIPLLYLKLEDCDPQSTLFRWHQRIWMFLMNIFPIMVLLFLFGRFLEAHVFVNERDTNISGLRHFWPFPSDIGLFDHATLGLHGPQYYMLLSPWITAGIVLVCILLLARLIVRIRRVIAT